jgi:DHA2 family multidrug resistance protein
VRVREQVHSNLIGLHVAEGAGLTADRLAEYASRLTAHVADPAVAAAQGAKLLAAAVATQANTLGYIDGFFAAALGSAVCLALVAAMTKGPESPF